MQTPYPSSSTLADHIERARHLAKYPKSGMENVIKTILYWLERSRLGINQPQSYTFAGPDNQNWTVGLFILRDTPWLSIEWPQDALEDQVKWLKTCTESIGLSTRHVDTPNNQVWICLG